MRIVFIGSGEIALPSLQLLLESDQLNVVGVVTQPAKPKGRRRKETHCAIGNYVAENNLPVIAPEKIGDPLSLQHLESWQPDLLVVVAYGQYLPESVLNVCRNGAINMHPSLLPKYRGATPIQWTLANGDSETGVTILKVTRDLDAGDIVLQKSMTVEDNDTGVSLSSKLAVLGAELLLETIYKYSDGSVEFIPQDNNQATYVGKLNKEDGLIDWKLPASVIRNRIRGFQPWPICHCSLPQKKDVVLRVYSAEVVAGEGSPGEIIEVTKSGLVIATGTNALKLQEVQLPGKNKISGRELLNGYKFNIGQYFS